MFSKFISVTFSIISDSTSFGTIGHVSVGNMIWALNVSLVQPSTDNGNICVAGLSTVKPPNVIHNVTKWATIIPVAAPWENKNFYLEFLQWNIVGTLRWIRTCYTFQLQHGTSMARMKIPNRGPLVAEVTSMDDSMTPERRPTPKLMPIMTQAYRTPMALMTHNCWPSFSSRKHGKLLMKSSHVTVAREFKLDTFKLKSCYQRTS